MKPYYEDAEAGITIYHGDCREVLAAIELPPYFVTDPVYGIEGGVGGDSRKFGKGRYHATDWEDTPEYVKTVCVPVVQRLVDGCQAGAVTPGIRMLRDYPAWRDMGVFWSPAAATHGPWGFTTIQPILYYGRDWRSGIGSLPSGLQLTASAPRNGHPCPKPLSAWSWLVEKVTPAGETVLDPFMGSGTTLRAAKDLGRKAIGIEIEERYCEIAAQQLSQQVLAL